VWHVEPLRAISGRDGHFERLPSPSQCGAESECDDDIRSGNFGLAVMTYEKLIGLLVEHAQRLNHCSTLVVDEVQMLATADAAAAWRCC
jgi:hypothetical protein